MQREQRAVGFFRQQLRFGQRAWRDNALNLALDRSLAGGRVADLFTEGDGFAQLDQLGEVLVDRVEGHAGHLDRRAVRCAALGQRDAEQACGLLGVIKEQFVKITHPVKQQQVRIVGLDAQVLLHHGRVLFGAVPVGSIHGFRTIK